MAAEIILSSIVWSGVILKGVVSACKTILFEKSEVVFGIRINLRLWDSWQYLHGRCFPLRSAIQVHSFMNDNV